MSNPKAVDLRESRSAVRIRQWPKARVRGDGSPATPWPHFGFGEVNAEPRDLDRLDDLRQ